MDHPTFKAADPQYEARVRASFGRQEMMRTLGVRITSLGPGWIELEFDHDERFTQQHGFLHAGAIAAVLDSACGYAAFSLMPDDAAVLTVEYKINLLKPASHDRYKATGIVVRSGRTLTVCRGQIEPDSGEPIAIMTGTLATVTGTSIQH
ncbi:MAG: PaaI family thioesterase [Acidimicrobiia bacterium]|nr:PaaI family thioesterase [Acidimicrobiia bacterium]